LPDPDNPAGPADTPAPALQVAITDYNHLGKFISVWQRISAPHSLRMLRAEPFPNGTCFRMALHNPHVHAASLYSR
jgi:hypothetical protein